MARLNQCEMVLNHLETFGNITDVEAYNLYGIRRLAARIFDLQRRGINIAGKTVSGKNRYGVPTSYAQYSIVAAGDADG